MTKRLKIAIAILLICALSFVLVACFEKEDDTNDALKPDINLALKNYDKLPVRRSDFSAKLTMTLYNGEGKSGVNTIKIGQGLSLKRIANNGQIYMDGNFGSVDVDSDAVSTIISMARIMLQISGDTDKLIALNDAEKYLNGENYYTVKVGYADGTYNLKTQYNKATDSDSFWGATDEENINSVFYDMGIDLGIIPSDYLMFSTFINISEAKNWITGDKETRAFNKDHDAFLYDFVADSSKIRDYIFHLVDKIISEVVGESILSEKDKVEKLLPYIDKWLTVDGINVTAKVGKDQLPQAMTTTASVRLSILKSDISSIIDLLVEDEEERDLIKGYAESAYAILSDSTGNKKGLYLDAKFDLVLSETFKYSAKDCSLAGKDADMFLPLSSSQEGRQEFVKNRPSEDETD